MAERDGNDDRSIYAVVDKIIQNLLPLDQYSRLRVYRTVGTFFGFENSYRRIDRNVDNRSSANISREPRFSTSEELTPKEFLLLKQPNTIVERVACLAYYLTQYRNMQQFKTLDISKLNTEAAQTKLSNALYAIRDAISTGYLATEKGMNKLSARGEQYVDALPDREAAMKVKPRNSKRPSRKSA